MHWRPTLKLLDNLNDYEYQLDLTGWQCCSNSNFTFLCVCSFDQLLKVMLKFPSKVYSPISLALSILLYWFFKALFGVPTIMIFISSWWIFSFTIIECSLLCLVFFYLDLLGLVAALYIFYPIFMFSYFKYAYYKPHKIIYCFFIQSVILLLLGLVSVLNLTVKNILNIKSTILICVLYLSHLLFPCDPFPFTFF